MMEGVKIAFSCAGNDIGSGAVVQTTTSALETSIEHGKRTRFLAHQRMGQVQAVD